MFVVLGIHVEDDSVDLLTRPFKHREETGQRRLIHISFFLHLILITYKSNKKCLIIYLNLPLYYVGQEQHRWSNSCVFSTCISGLNFQNKIKMTADRMCTHISLKIKTEFVNASEQYRDIIVIYW